MESYTHIEYILVVIIKYEVIGPSLIVIICHSNFFWWYNKLTGNTFLLVLSHIWVGWAVRTQKTLILPEMQRHLQTFSQYNYTRLFWTWETQASHTGLSYNINLYHVVKKRGLQSEGHVLQGTVKILILVITKRKYWDLYYHFLYCIILKYLFYNVHDSTVVHTYNL